MCKSAIGWHAPGCLCADVCMCICVFVYLPSKLLMNNGTVWSDMALPYVWLSKSYNLKYMAVMVSTVSKFGFELKHDVVANPIRVT